MSHKIEKYVTKLQNTQTTSDKFKKYLSHLNFWHNRYTHTLTGGNNIFAKFGNGRFYYTYEPHQSSIAYMYQDTTKNTTLSISVKLSGHNYNSFYEFIYHFIYNDANSRVDISSVGRIDNHKLDKEFDYTISHNKSGQYATDDLDPTMHFKINKLLSEFKEHIPSNFVQITHDFYNNLSEPDTKKFTVVNNQFADKIKHSSPPTDVKQRVITLVRKIVDKQLKEIK